MVSLSRSALNHETASSLRSEGALRTRLMLRPGGLGWAKVGGDMEGIRKARGKHHDSIMKKMREQSQPPPLFIIIENWTAAASLQPRHVAKPHHKPSPTANRSNLHTRLGWFQLLMQRMLVRKEIILKGEQQEYRYDYIQRRNINSTMPARPSTSWQVPSLLVGL